MVQSPATTRRLIWAVVFMLAGGVIHDLQGNMFGLGPHELNVIHYCGMGLTKLTVGVFFFIPRVSWHWLRGCSDGRAPPVPWRCIMRRDPMIDIKGQHLYVNLGASQVRQRLKGFGHGVRKVQSAGKNRAVVIHTATGQHLRELEAVFGDVKHSTSEDELNPT